MPSIGGIDPDVIPSFQTVVYFLAFIDLPLRFYIRFRPG
jgi:hypothetical protein